MYENEYDSGGNGGGKSSSKSLTDAPKNGTVRLDMNGVPYYYPTYNLPKNEYAHVFSEISTNWHTNFKGIAYCELNFSKKVYLFENRGFGDYNIYDVIKKEAAV